MTPPEFSRACGWTEAGLVRGELRLGGERRDDHGSGPS
jgi:hypothetical protein